MCHASVVVDGRVLTDLALQFGEFGLWSPSKEGGGGGGPVFVFLTNFYRRMKSVYTVPRNYKSGQLWSFCFPVK